MVLDWDVPRINDNSIKDCLASCRPFFVAFRNSEKKACDLWETFVRESVP